MTPTTKTVSLEWQTEEFRAALEEFMRGSKRDIATVLRQQVKKIIERIMGNMPPAKGTGREKGEPTDKKKGEMAIAVDVSRIVKVVSQKTLDDPLANSDEEFGHAGAKALGTIKIRTLDSVGDIKRWHQDRRRKDGRVMKVDKTVTTGLRKRDLKGLDQGLTSKKLLNAYLKEAYKKVGYLASGWKAAARKLGSNVPKWIDRNNAPGSAIVTESWRGITIEAVNDVRWASANGTERRVQWAVDVQRQKLERQIEANLDRLANKFSRSR